MTDTDGRVTTTEVEPVGDGSPTEHEVKDGESLTEIAELYGITLAELAKSNPELFETRDPDLIHPGETIIIEEGSKTTVTIEFDGQTLTTYPDGSVELTYADGTVIQIASGSLEETLAHLLLSANPHSSDPEEAKEGEIIATVVTGLLAGKTYEALLEEAAAKAEDVQSAIDTYGIGPETEPTVDTDGRNNQIVNLFGEPPDEETPSGIWVPVSLDGKYHWVDQKVALAIRAENLANAKLNALPATFEEGLAQLDAWALDADFDQAMSDAANALNEAISPHGVSWESPAPGGTLAEAETRLDEASAARELADGAVQAYAEAASLTGDTFTDPDQVDATLFEIDALTTEGDSLSVDYTVAQLEDKLDTLEEGSEEYEYFDGELQKAKDLQEAFESKSDLASAYADYYNARGDLASVQSLQEQIVEEWQKQNPMPEDPDWNHIAGNGAFLGKLEGTETFVDDDGQLWLVLHYETQDVKWQLTYDICDPNAPQEIRDSELNQQWQAIGPDLSDLKENELVAGKELNETLEDQLDIQINDNDALIEDLQEEFDELYVELGSENVEPPEGEQVEITVAGQTVLVSEEVAKAYEETGIEAISDLGQPVRIEIDGQQVWVDAELAVAKIALDAAQETGSSLEDAREAVRDAVSYSSFQLTQPISPLDSPAEIARMQSTYLEQHEQEMLDSFFQPQIQALASEYGNEFPQLSENRIAEALQIDPATEPGKETIELVSAKINEIGDMDKVRIVPFFHVEEAVGARRTALFAVEDSDEKTWYVDESGMTFESIQDFQESNCLFSPDAKLVIPSDLQMQQDGTGEIPLEVVAGHNTSEVETVVDTSVSIVTTAAAGLSVIPVLTPFTAPIALVGGAYLGGRALNDEVDYLSHGGDFFDSRSLMNVASVATSVLPIAGSSLRWAGTVKNLGNLSKGEIYLASLGTVRSTSVIAAPNAKAINSYLRTGGEWSLAARVADRTAMGIGTPLAAVSAQNLILNWDQMSSLEIADALAGFASGFAAAALGARGTLSNRADRQWSDGSGTVPGEPLPTDIAPPSADGTTVAPIFGDGDPTAVPDINHDHVLTAQRSAAETAALSAVVKSAGDTYQQAFSAERELIGIRKGLNKRIREAEKQKKADEANRLKEELAEVEARREEAAKDVKQAKITFEKAEDSLFEGRVREILRWSIPEFAGETRFLNGKIIDRDLGGKHAHPDGYLEQEWGSGRPTNFLALEVKNFRKHRTQSIRELYEQINKRHPHIETEGRHVRHAVVIPSKAYPNETRRIEIATKLNAETNGKVHVEDVFFLTDHGDTATLESAVPVRGPDRFGPGGEQRYRMDTETLRQPFFVLDVQSDGHRSDPLPDGKDPDKQGAPLDPDRPDTSHVSALSPEEVAALSKKELGSYSVWEMEALTRPQIESLSPGQLSSLAPRQFRKFAPEQVAWMSPEQLDALSVAKLRPYQRTHGKTMTPDQKATVELALSFARMREYQQGIDILVSMFNTSHSMYVMMPELGLVTAGAYTIRSAVFGTQSLFPNATASDTKLGRSLNISSGFSFLGSSPGTWLSFLGGSDRIGDGASMGGNLIYGPGSIYKGLAGAPVLRFLSDHAGNLAYLVGSASLTMHAGGAPMATTAGLLFTFASAEFWASAIRTDKVYNKPVPRTLAEIAQAAKSDARWAMADRIALGAGFSIGMGLLAVDKLMSTIAQDEAGEPVEQADEVDQEAEIEEDESPRISGPGRYNPKLEQEGYLWVDVMEGDSVRTIANAHFADVAETAMLNMDHIFFLDLVQPGDRIYLPTAA
ncbi:LysM domain-containing protein [Mesorhizobium sp. 1M-11]|uniref:LysM peptidoglycan-binding domain-containing protein n=1 Tax=Mesorhizobium sp. 1M-11 TaxID=1529006 RepID=UPI0013794DA5|nr:LysM domain-containing protein [Mesorhizobium sp. 1M-11]